MNVSAHCFNRQRAMAKAACFKIVFVFSVTGETEPSKLKCLCVRTASPWDWGLRVCRAELFTMRYFCGATASAHLTQSVGLFRRVRAVRSWRSEEETSLALLSRPVQAECALILQRWRYCRLHWVILCCGCPPVHSGCLAISLASARRQDPVPQLGCHEVSADVADRVCP